MLEKYLKIENDIRSLIVPILYIMLIPSIAIYLFGSGWIVLPALSLGLFIAYYAFCLAYDKKTKEIKSDLDLIEFGTVFKIKNKNGSISKNAIRDSISLLSISGSQIANCLRNAPKLMEFMDFKNSIRKMLSVPDSMHGQSMRLLLALHERAESGLDMSEALESVCESAYERVDKTFSNYVQKIQRNSTMLMLFSTVIPSFFLFGLAGYSILYTKASILPLAFALFVVVVPIMYSSVSKFSLAVSNALV